MAMRVTNATAGILARIREEERARTVTLSKKLKNGSWGKPRVYTIIGIKTPEEFVADLEKYNPGNTWKIVK